MYYKRVRKPPTLMGALLGPIFGYDEVVEEELPIVEITVEEALQDYKTQMDRNNERSKDN